jgi:hypothetical protein
MTKVYIDLPIYTTSSNGIRCLYDLSHELRKRGYLVIAVPRDIEKYRKCINNLPPHTREIPIAKEPGGSIDDILIVSETVPLCTVNVARARNMRIAWWQLAPYCLLEQTGLPRHGEFNMPFSSYAEPGADFYFYYQPVLSAEWEDCINSPIVDQESRQSLLIYSGKGRLKRLPEKLLDFCSRSQINMITRSTPRTRKELFSLMTSCHGLISFDELTNLNLEAASVGLPVFLANPLFSVASRQQFSVSSYIDHVCLDADEFLRRVYNRMNGIFGTIKASDLLSNNSKTIDMIEKIIANDQDAPQFIVRDHDRLNYRQYVKSLKRRRVIFTHIGGHAGGSLLFNWYCRQVQLGKNSSTMLLVTRVLDYLYCYLNIFLVPLTIFGLRINKALHLVLKKVA